VVSRNVFNQESQRDYESFTNGYSMHVANRFYKKWHSKLTQASLLSFAGNDDKIVSLKSSRKIMDVITAEDKEFRVVPGGHAGVFAGRKAVDYVWGASAEWLARRSN
ncbi:MAG: hypothetical protein HQM12_23220, partial [SAR324 cluster bacterium]|nr:hypothetical protein [SAR324 cluster bacterium]